MLLAWDTDGDGVVEFHEVRSVLFILTRRALRRMSCARSSDRSSATRPESKEGRRRYVSSSILAAEAENKSIGGRNALYGLLDAVRCHVGRTATSDSSQMPAASLRLACG